MIKNTKAFRQDCECYEVAKSEMPRMTRIRLVKAEMCRILDDYTV